MLNRMATLLVLLVCGSFAGIAQVTSNIGQYNTGVSQPACSGRACGSDGQPGAGPAFPNSPMNGKLDFKASDASVSCAVVKFDSAVAMPILHLLCPGPEIFAPLRVHLMLTWKSQVEVPEDVRSMLIDTSSPVKFKSKPGDSEAELTFRDSQASSLKKEWITFTNVNVGLVLPSKQHQ